MKQTISLRDVDAVLMRQDPPFDFEYITATWMLERAVAGGARVFNHPRAIRDHSEKVSICEFPDLITPTLVSRDVASVNAFIDTHADCILKPLDSMGGARIFRVRHDDPNRNVIIETLNNDGSDTLMAQRFIPEITQGDKRILLIDGEPVPFCLARIPKAGETRGNLAPVAGACGAAAVRERLAHRARARAYVGSAWPAAGRTGRDRRSPDRNQCHQPHLFR
jgi:glutathione synthase